MLGQIGRATLGVGCVALVMASCGTEFQSSDDGSLSGEAGQPAGVAGKEQVGDAGSNGTVDRGGSDGQAGETGQGGAGVSGCDCAVDQVCEAGECVAACSESETWCDGCVDTLTDVSHCGDCETTCDADMDCIEGKCVVPCEDSLRQPITDIWGDTWDGLERAGDTFANAQAACAEGGARLPRVTESFRVSATQSATVGQSNHTNYIWSATPRDATAQMMVRLSDGVIAAYATAAANKLNYRCMCPALRPPDFTEGACNGPPDEGCFALGGELGRYNIDIKDRPALAKSAAIWECQQDNAHLADFNRYVEAIQAGLPGGSGAWLHTADDAHYANGTVVKWVGTHLGWSVTGNTGIMAMTTPQPFRCIGLNYEPGVSSVALENEHIERPSGFKSSASDEAAATFAAAHDICFAKGGHLARVAELSHLITSGLPGGTGVAVWTSDGAGFGPANQFLTMVSQWTGTLSIFPHANTALVTGNVTWAYKNGAAAGYRCVYYPVDERYEGPTADSCNGGCYELAVADGPATMWFDKLDRAPATLETAIAGCVSKGGKLPSERDLTEAVRGGLPGGTNAWLSTWDIMYGSQTPMLAHSLVRWLAEDTAFNGLYPTYMTWSATATPRNYRCMWTNELR